MAAPESVVELECMLRGGSRVNLSKQLARSLRPPRLRPPLLEAFVELCVDRRDRLGQVVPSWQRRSLLLQASPPLRLRPASAESPVHPRYSYSLPLLVLAILVLLSRLSRSDRLLEPQHRSLLRQHIRPLVPLDLNVPRNPIDLEVDTWQVSPDVEVQGAVSP